ncbi:hypothetical protein TRFO_21670 [Tritrichomonas foetus]|uniref:Peptidase M60 domain-containing protein n=1 Tax=Tritrichomonas foetus TaxID=1144522 RepID=A0A1J4KDV0_9EUKA|nr:hypothetical protein TRFO_21670 [Tritrichomonas foetus]|eukprot:OHT09371.1 hypothetical protein TRFO_21670 [Tritrichomonas foetus]
MGCSSSVSTKARVHNSNSLHNTQTISNNQQRNQGQNKELSIKDHFYQIVNGVRSVATPNKMMTIVCFNSRNSFPIVASYIHLDDSTPTDIQLPIIAGAVYNNSRIVCFSQVQYLFSKNLRLADTTKVVTNCIEWAGGGKNTMMPILILGFGKQTHQIIQKNLQDLGFFVESGNFTTDFRNYKVIVIPTNIRLDDSRIAKFSDYIENCGGGLIVMYQHDDSTYLKTAYNNPINKILIKYGLAYSYCLLNEYDDSETADNIQVNSSYLYNTDMNFISVIYRLKATLKQTNLEMSFLDDLVATLKYYVAACDEVIHENELNDIFNSIWEFLERTNYNSQDGICENIIQKIVVVLLLEIYGKMLPKNIKPIPYADFFPGKTGKVKMLKKQELTFQMHDDEWIRTGLWLPAGIVGTIECNSEKCRNIQIQVGSHHESLVIQNDQWKRWPSIVTIKQVQENTTEFATPFGGILYLTYNIDHILESMSEDYCENNFTFDMTFSNFCKYPIYDFDNEDIWKETKNLDIPMSEIYMKNIIFTLPTEYIMKISNFDIIRDTFQLIICEIEKFHHYKVNHPFRIVFDIDLPENEPVCGYPMIFNITDINSILFDIEKPSKKLFQLVTFMSILYIKENCLDDTTESALSTVSASIVFQHLYEKFDPYRLMNGKVPLLFEEFWQIHTRLDQKLIPETLRIYQENEENGDIVSPDDRWLTFVRTMCKIARKDLTKFLNRVKPIPLSVVKSMEGLPEYATSCPRNRY